MSGLSDFVDYSWKSTVGRGKDFLKSSTNPKNAFKSGLRGQVGKGGLFDVKRDVKFLEEDADRLFVGEPEKPYEAPAAEPTLKAAPDTNKQQTDARRRRVLSASPKKSMSVLGG